MSEKDIIEPTVSDKPSDETALMPRPRPTDLDLFMILHKVFKPDFETPKLESENLQIALSKLSEARYRGLNDVAKILMPDLQGGAIDVRSKISDVISPRAEGKNEMNAKSIMAGLYLLFSSDYPDLVGVARIWVPDFDKKIELIGAKNIKLVPVISPAAPKPGDDDSKKRGWVGMLRICYETVEPITSEEQVERTESAGCHPIYDHELDNFCKKFPHIVRLPAATSGITKGEGNWYMFVGKAMKALGSQALEITGGKMPTFVTLVAVCEPKFWQPLAKKNEKDEK